MTSQTFKRILPRDQEERIMQEIHKGGDCYNKDLFPLVYQFVTRNASGSGLIVPERWE
jgi:hypothetical protein